MHLPILDALRISMLSSVAQCLFGSYASRLLSASCQDEDGDIAHEFLVEDEDFRPDGNNDLIA